MQSIIHNKIYHIKTISLRCTGIILIITGNVGAGFNTKSLNDIHLLLLQNKGQTNPFIIKPPGSSRAHWLKLNLVCEVEFTEWTEDGHLRHPSFKWMRLDKKANNVA